MLLKAEMDSQPAGNKMRKKIRVAKTRLGVKSWYLSLY
jgi:hypothetical protein